MRADYRKLKGKLRLLYRKRRTAPAYQKELIQREIIRTRMLLDEVYGEDRKQQSSAFGGFLGILFTVGFLVALPLFTSDRIDRDAKELL